MITFCTKLHEQNVKGYIVDRSRRIIQLGLNMLKCSTVEGVLSKLDFIYDNIEVHAKWTGRSRMEYFASFNNVLRYFPDLISKIPNEYWNKVSRKYQIKNITPMKRKLVINSDSEDDKTDNIVKETKKIKLVEFEKPKDVVDYSKLTFYELSMHDSLWKTYFVRKDDEVLVHQRSSKVKFNITNVDDIKRYVVRVLEAQINEAYSINVIFNCKLKYGQDKLNSIIIRNATKNVRDVANHLWKEMVEPFYKVSMTV